MLLKGQKYVSDKQAAKAIAALLKNVNPLSFWGNAIHLAIKNPTPEVIEELIISLRSQAKDNAQMMREILGSIIYDTIILP